MRKLFAIVILLVTLTQSSSACEICGCGVGNIYIGVLPQFKSHFVGLRYHFNKFNTRLSDDPSQFSKDFYQTAELWSGWNIGKRIQLLTFIPVNFNHQVSDEGVQNHAGLGDIVIMANYKVVDINSKTGKGKSIIQQLWIGGGIKLPTGKFELEENNTEVASMANMQLGSGTTDVLLNAVYNVRIRKFGITTQANYKFNGSNNDQFQFGNKFTASSFVSYGLNAGNNVISPNLGLMYETTEASKWQSDKVELTGGSLLQIAPGIEFGFNKISVGMNVQLPIAQNFAEDQTKQKIKGMVHVSYAF